MRMIAYIVVMALALQADGRWELYRVLSDPTRLRLLVLAEAEELTIGELAQLIEESQSKISRHVAVLKRAGLLTVRREGTRSFVGLTSGRSDDPVVLDALKTGRALANDDGSLNRIVDVIRDREAPSKAYFSQGQAVEQPEALPSELPAYLGLLSRFISPRQLAVDVGTGNGAMLDLWGPIFERVVALDRSEAQLDSAKARAAHRGYKNIEFRCTDFDDAPVLEEFAGTADLVSASRVLHHSALPGKAVAALARYLSPGGWLMLVDYRPHGDERMREEQADLWLGFSPRELKKFAESAGLKDVEVLAIPDQRRGQGPDSHLPWQALLARQPK